MNGRVIAAAFLVFIPSAANCQEVVRSVDHAMVRYATTDDLLRVSRVLSNTFGLPLATPPQDAGGYYNAMVYLGGMTLEPLTVNRPLGDRRFSIALDVEDIDRAAVVLRTRGVSVSDPVAAAFDHRSGKSDTTWTTASLRDLSTPTTSVYLVHYAPATFPWFTTTPQATNSVERDMVLQERMEQDQGGPLRIVGVKRLLFGVADLEQASVRWSFIGTVREVEDVVEVSFAGGPRIRLLEVRNNPGLIEICLSTADLDRATAWLTEWGVSFERLKAGKVLLDPDLFSGLHLALEDSDV